MNENKKLALMYALKFSKFSLNGEYQYGRFSKIAEKIYDYLSDKSDTLQFEDKTPTSDDVKKIKKKGI